MIILKEFTGKLPAVLQPYGNMPPWEILRHLKEILTKAIASADMDYRVEGSIAIHRTAVIEEGAVCKPPLFIGPHCFVAAHACLRGGVFLESGVTIGHGCEVKSGIILAESHLAHFNFVGDSILCRLVNIEAGAILANHFNERADKQIRILHKGNEIYTGVEKFGALVGDGSKIGANAVLSPGSILEKNTTVKRLTLWEQSPEG